MPRGDRSGSGGSRGVRFSEDNGHGGVGIDVELMRAAVADQTNVQHEYRRASQVPQAPQASPRFDNSSPFTPGYSLAEQPRANARPTRDVGPLERNDSADQFSISTRDDDAKSESSEESKEFDKDDILEYTPAGSRRTSERRPTGAFEAAEFASFRAKRGSDAEDESPSGPPKKAGASNSNNNSDMSGFTNPFETAAAQANARNIHGLELPLRPQPSAATPQQGTTSRNVSGAYGTPTSQFPGSPRGMMSPQSANEPFTPKIQYYDPLSSPSMVQPFSPRVTASGSIKSPLLKPALSRRDQSTDQFNLNSSDSLERGSAPQPTAAPNAGLAKSLVGLYGAFNSAGNGTPGRGAATPAFHMHKDDDSDEATLNGDMPSPTKGKVTDIAPDELPYAYQAQSPRPPMYNMRRDSTIMDDDEAMDENDPRLTGLMRKSMQLKHQRQQDSAFDHRRSSWSSETGDPTIRRPARRRVSLGNMKIEFGNDDDDGYTAPRRKSFDRRKSATTITKNVSHLQQRQKFILKLAKALMMFGAPSHRLESQLNATAAVLEVDCQVMHLPGIVIATFTHPETEASETHFVKSGGGLVLGQLSEVHTIYRRVVHDECSVDEGTQELTKLIKQKPIYGVWTRILIAGGLCFVIAPLSFGGSFIDAWASAVFGILNQFLNLRIAKNNAMYANIFEISVAILISFISRALSTTEVFCYQAIASSGVVLVLPGYIILCGSLELASKNMIAGSVRMVYAIIYSLFLGFGIAIGSDLYFVLDPAARQSMYVPISQAETVAGSFTFTNESIPVWNGTFSFSNSSAESAGSSLKLGNINCEREPGDPWWKAGITVWMNFLWVPAFSFLLCMHNMQPWKSKELPVMIIIACIGFAVNLLANHFIFNRSDVVSAIGSFVIGILGNAYSRIFRGTAFTAMAVAVLFLVPSGMAMAGGLAMTYKGSDGDLYSNGLSIGLRMVTVSIGVCVGLLGAGVVVYSFGRKKGAALFAF